MHELLIRWSRTTPAVQTWSRVGALSVPNMWKRSADPSNIFASREKTVREQHNGMQGGVCLLCWSDSTLEVYQTLVHNDRS